MGKKLEDDDSKKKEKVVKVEGLYELKQVDSKLSLIAMETNLELQEEYFHLKIQMKQRIIEAIVDSDS